MLVSRALVLSGHEQTASAQARLSLKPLQNTVYDCENELVPQVSTTALIFYSSTQGYVHI